MIKQKNVIRTLDLKPNKKGEGLSEVSTGESFSKRLWEGRFAKLCNNLKENFGNKTKQNKTLGYRDIQTTKVNPKIMS